MPIKLGKWIRGWKLGSWFKRQFRSLDDQAKKLLPAVIAIVEEVKKVVDSGVANMVTDIIPGTIDDTIKEKARKALPVLIMKLRVAESIVGIEDPTEQIKAILASLKFSSDEDRNAFYHSLSALMLELLSDGKFSWSDAVILAEMYYRYEHKKAA